MEALKEIVLCLCTLFLCPMYIIWGLFLMNNPPKEINSLYGYMSKMSKKSPEAWSFAQSYAGKRIFWSGIITLILLLPVYFIFFNAENFHNVRYILLILQVIPSFIARGITEKALRDNFNLDGTVK